jgi:hypothetical protein
MDWAEQVCAALAHHRVGEVVEVLQGDFPGNTVVRIAGGGPGGELVECTQSIPPVHLVECTIDESQLATTVRVRYFD